MLFWQSEPSLTSLTDQFFPEGISTCAVLLPGLCRMPKPSSARWSLTYEIEEQDYEPSDDLDDLEWQELLGQPDSNALDLSGSNVFGALQSAAARGDGRAHLAMALIEDLALQDEADFDQPKGRDGI